MNRIKTVLLGAVAVAIMALGSVAPASSASWGAGIVTSTTNTRANVKIVDYNGNDGYCIRILYREVGGTWRSAGVCSHWEHYRYYTVGSNKQITAVSICKGYSGICQRIWTR